VARAVVASNFGERKATGWEQQSGLNLRLLCRVLCHQRREGRPANAGKGGEAPSMGGRGGGKEGFLFRRDYDTWTRSKGEIGN